MQWNHIDVLIFPINTFLNSVPRLHNIYFKALALVLWTSTGTILWVQDTRKKCIEVGVAG